MGTVRPGDSLFSPVTPPSELAERQEITTIGEGPSFAEPDTVGPGLDETTGLVERPDACLEPGPALCLNGPASVPSPDPFPTPSVDDFSLVFPRPVGRVPTRSFELPKQFESLVPFPTPSVEDSLLVPFPPVGRVPTSDCGLPSQSSPLVPFPTHAVDESLLEVPRLTGSSPTMNFGLSSQDERQSVPTILEDSHPFRFPRLVCEVPTSNFELPPWSDSPPPVLLPEANFSRPHTRACGPVADLPYVQDKPLEYKK